MTKPLQQLIATYLKDHPDEDYRTISRRGDIPYSTVHALATRRPDNRSTPRPATLRKLAKGLGMSEAMVLDAAGVGAGYGSADVAHESPEIQMLIATVRELKDPEKIEAVLRRARLLLEEQRQEREAARKRRR